MSRSENVARDRAGPPSFDRTAAAPVNISGYRDAEAEAVSALQQPIASVFAAIKPQFSHASSLMLQIAAAIPGEGTSTVARELAFVAASVPWCRVLLLDANPGAGGQAGWFGLASSPDLGTSLHNGPPIDTVRIARSDAAFDLAALAIGAAPGGCRAAPAMVQSAFAHLRSVFSLIIVDCPSILSVPETAALSAQMDGTLLVIEAERTRAPVVSRAREQIEAAGGSVRGVVMNKRRQYIPKLLYNLL